ncbi:MAG: hypothetical protein R3C32_11565 [Chloroflexota bacterium]
MRELGVQYNLRFHKQTRLRTSFRNLLRRDGGEQRFWALRDATFYVRQGESVGSSGPTGPARARCSSRSRASSMPSHGAIEVNGHISTLLSLQAGFDQEPSGADNIRLAGALMGIPARHRGAHRARGHRVRRRRPVHRRAAQDLQLGHAGAPRLRHRHGRRP